MGDMGAFGEALRRLQKKRGVTLGGLAELTHYDKGYLSKVSNGVKAASEDVAQACDKALDARGELIAAARMDAAAARDARPWETAELVERIQASDSSTRTLERLEATVFELCCQYPSRNAAELRREAQSWLRHISGILHRPIGLKQHQEFLVSAGWLALLVGCLEYDLGFQAGAEATRVAARQLGEESRHSEILAWSYEMTAWFALTQGRFANVVSAAQVGCETDSTHSVRAQLLAQRAKALARLGDINGVRKALDAGAHILSSVPPPDRPEHHFMVDPDKWDFYAMDVYRLAGDSTRAALHAREVIAKETLPDGTERAPMRLTEARLTLGVVAARSGQLEEALVYGDQALQSARRSLPTLLMVASELDSVLQERYPGDPVAQQFSDRLRELAA